MLSKSLVVKENLICQVLRKQLGMTYKKFTRIPFQGNSNRSLVFRQHYAKMLIPLLNQGKRVINCDETWLPSLDFRRSKWCRRGAKNSKTVKDLS